MGGRGFSVLAIAAVLGGCGRERAPEGAAGIASPASAAAYLAPPRPTAVQPLREGALRVVGQAPPGAAVELTSPEGEVLEVRADPRGVWRLRLPNGAAGSPRLYAISARAGARVVRAEGALVTTPGALAPAVMVRAGDAAQPLIAGAGTVLAAVDYDPSGALAVSGGAPPRAPVSLFVDGAPSAVGHADAEGRYVLLAANHRLSFGPHTLEVRAPDRTAARRVVLEPAAPLASPYRAAPAPGGGWRVDWALTGGGEQTTLVLAP